ncbi:hypothetical protein PSC71_13155 [Devosia sp. J2-20]|uniref:hypothetical protein n=1 Tax=Devosia sp. J2-20 TaxID=3026161 RepID=UPI00249A3E1D|nr:hypothetical protein [Devosia sp. J2-20]WDQ98176.1 hypothetical protein PSC71_13155 [Devosia sp. J2-20]
MLARVLHERQHVIDSDWISITEAAKRLSSDGDQVDRSTLSRYVTQHAEALPTRREGKSNLVDFRVLAQHRSENVRLQLPSRPNIVGDLALSKQPIANISRGNAAARDKEAVAQMRELDLAERLGRVTSTSEVADAGQSAVVMMRNAFERAVESEAAALALKYGWDERVVRVSLKSFANVGVDVFHRELLTQLDKRRRAQDAGDDDQEPMALQ